MMVFITEHTVLYENLQEAFSYKHGFVLLVTKVLSPRITEVFVHINNTNSISLLQ